MQNLSLYSAWWWMSTFSVFPDTYYIYIYWHVVSCNSQVVMIWKSIYFILRKNCTSLSLIIIASNVFTQILHSTVCICVILIECPFQSNHLLLCKWFRFRQIQGLTTDLLVLLVMFHMFGSTRKQSIQLTSVINLLYQTQRLQTRHAQYHLT